MKLKQLFSIVFVVFCFLMPLGAEPLNIMVGDLTFTRPTTWQWKTPDSNSPAISRFIVPKPDSPAFGDVRFYGAGAEPEGAAKMWKAYFPKEDQETLRTETTTIGKRTVTYISLQGTLTLPKDKPLPAQGFVGVVIPYQDRFLHIRFSGPKELVEKAIPDLKNMVDTAVRERESDLENE
ncbi:MAG: hypothetical protein JWM68_5830 [Verrucomicrobiales bacterium]|nr:hypothetical protein [Verrucomicrobiales bacterium]